MKQSKGIKTMISVIVLIVSFCCLNLAKIQAQDVVLNATSGFLEINQDIVLKDVNLLNELADLRLKLSKSENRTKVLENSVTVLENSLTELTFQMNPLSYELFMIMNCSSIENCHCYPTNPCETGEVCVDNGREATCQSDYYPSSNFHGIPIVETMTQVGLIQHTTCDLQSYVSYPTYAEYLGHSGYYLNKAGDTVISQIGQEGDSYFNWYYRDENGQWHCGGVLEQVSPRIGPNTDEAIYLNEGETVLAAGNKFFPDGNDGYGQVRLYEVNIDRENTAFEFVQNLLPMHTVIGSRYGSQLTFSADGNIIAVSYFGYTEVWERLPGGTYWSRVQIIDHNVMVANIAIVGATKVSYNYQADTFLVRLNNDTHGMIAEYIYDSDDDSYVLQGIVATVESEGGSLVSTPDLLLALMEDYLYTGTDGLTNSGRIIHFERQEIGTDFEFFQYILPIDPATNKKFGGFRAISLRPDGLAFVIGNHYDDTVYENHGSVYLYTRESRFSSFTHKQKFLPSVAQGAGYTYIGKNMAMSWNTTRLVMSNANGYPTPNFMLIYELP